MSHRHTSLRHNGGSKPKRTDAPPPSGRAVNRINGDDETWSHEHSAIEYQIQGWGAPYFAIGPKGHVVVTPSGQAGPSIDLFELALDLKARGLVLPMLFRFSDIVGHRIARISKSFERAINEYEYPGTYRGVFPVKVNQQRHVVEEVVRSGLDYSFGLEAGSKPELLIALSLTLPPDALIICNGYKDTKYIETALLAQRLNKTVVIVLERLEEVDIVLDASERLGIVPVLGVRAKLTTKGVGRWARSAGDRAKFGLTTAEIVQLVDRLGQHDMLHTLQMLHFHIGSQISSIIPIKNALQEASNIYVELAKMGCAMGYMDVGGGLAIDYDGSKTDFHASKNYDLQEYAYDVVGSIQEACNKADVAVPTLVSESGRAVAAHHAVLVFEVVGKNEVRFGEPSAPAPEAHRLLQELYETYQGIMPKNVQESFHDASQAKEESQSLFRYGYLTLRERAQAERLYWHCCEKIHNTLGRVKFIPEELQDLNRTLSAIYYCNFSIFQSAPDIWAINQLFPIMPIHRLDERPSVSATLADLTCDSDGQIENFIDLEDVKDTLNVHPIRQGEPYLMGMFLNGAYQEILGDLHNLFGDTNAAHVKLEGDGYRVEHVVKGDSVTEVLRYVEYDPEHMVEAVRRQAEGAVSERRLTNEQMRMLLDHYEASLRSYTYLTED